MVKDTLSYKISSPQKRQEMLKKERQLKVEKDIEKNRRKKDLQKIKQKYEKK